MNIHLPVFYSLSDTHLWNVLIQLFFNWIISFFSQNSTLSVHETTQYLPPISLIYYNLALYPPLDWSVPLPALLPLCCRLLAALASPFFVRWDLFAVVRCCRCCSLSAENNRSVDVSVKQYNLNPEARITCPMKWSPVYWSAVILIYPNGTFYRSDVITA